MFPTKSNVVPSSWKERTLNGSSLAFTAASQHVIQLRDLVRPGGFSLSSSHQEASLTTMPWLHLPVEVWFLIISAIGHQKSHTGRWRDLLNLSWTCRIAHAVAQPFIWHTLAIVFGSERATARSTPPADSELTFPYQHRHQLHKSCSHPLATVVVDPAHALLGSVCKLPHLLLNGRLYLVGTHSPCGEPKPILLHPWPAKRTRRVVVHDNCPSLFSSPNMQMAAAQLLRTLTLWLGDRIESVQVISNGGCLFDVMCADLLRPFKPRKSSAVRLPLANPSPFFALPSASSRVAHSLVLRSSESNQSPALRHMFPSLVRLISDLQLHGSFDFIFSEYHGWLPSITRLFSNTILSSLTLLLRLPLKQWTLHQSHQFPVHMPALASLSLSFEAAAALFTQVDKSSAPNSQSFPSLTHLELLDHCSGLESGEPIRVPYIPFTHMPNLSHLHVQKHLPTSSHALHVDHIAGLGLCPKLVSLRFPAVHRVLATDWTPSLPHHFHQTEQHQAYSMIPSIRELEIGELVATNISSDDALPPSSWIPSVANATSLVYHCRGDCSLPSVHIPSLDSAAVTALLPKLTRLAIHAPAGSIALAFFMRLAVAAPNLVTLCVYAGSVAVGGEQEWEQLKVPLTLRLLALHLGEGCGGVQGMLRRLELPDLCKVKVSVGFGESVL